jgi:hypothetical protein
VFSQRASPSCCWAMFEFSMLNQVTAEYRRAWLTGRLAPVIAAHEGPGWTFVPLSQIEFSTWLLKPFA